MPDVLEIKDYFNYFQFPKIHNLLNYEYSRQNIY